MSFALKTSAGDVPLHEYRLGIGGRTWTILHTDAVLTLEDEARFLGAGSGRMPYGIVLWPAAIALAHELASRADSLRGVRALELGAGTGLPGIVAATCGARVVQTDREELALAVSRENARRNGITGIETRAADWTAWTDDARYDLVFGSDILYADSVHADLRRIFERNLAPGGRVLLSDPFRGISMGLLEALEADGWRISMSRWSVTPVGGGDPRQIGVFELVAP